MCNTVAMLRIHLGGMCATARNLLSEETVNLQTILPYLNFTPLFAAVYVPQRSARCSSPLRNNLPYPAQVGAQQRSCDTYCVEMVVTTWGVKTALSGMPVCCTQRAL